MGSRGTGGRPLAPGGQCTREMPHSLVPKRCSLHPGQLLLAGTPLCSARSLCHVQAGPGECPPSPLSPGGRAGGGVQSGLLFLQPPLATACCCISPPPCPAVRVSPGRKPHPDSNLCFLSSRQSPHMRLQLRPSAPLPEAQAASTPLAQGQSLVTHTREVGTAPTPGAEGGDFPGAELERGSWGI